MNPTNDPNRIWTVKVTQADDPEANSTNTYLLPALEQIAIDSAPGSLYRFALYMEAGDSFTFTSEVALSTFKFECQALTEGELVKCSRCDNQETILGEISSDTLEGEGWYLGADGTDSNLCPEHNDENASEEGED